MSVIMVTGQLFVGALGAISDIDGTGGVALTGAEGKRFRIDTGFQTDINKNGEFHMAHRIQGTPFIIAFEGNSDDNAEATQKFSPLADIGGVGAALLLPFGNPGQQSHYKDLLRQSLLLIPTDQTKRYVYVHGAQLHPDTAKGLEFGMKNPFQNGEIMLLASGLRDDTKKPWGVGDKTQIEGEFFP